MKKNLGFIGAGNMAGALLSGIISTGLYSASDIAISDPDTAKVNEMVGKYGVNVFKDNSELVSNCDIVLLAIKPQLAKNILTSLKFTGNPLFISIVAGITIEKLESYLPKGTAVVRVMPNTPALIHLGSSVYTGGNCVVDDDMAAAAKILSCVGSAYKMDEKLIDAASAVHGSGPAYFYMMIEAMADAGVKLGLTRDMAITLAAETAKGAAAMILETKQHPAVLKDMVTSPAGSTIEALHEFEKGGLRGVIMNGVTGAAKRAAELGKEA